MEKLYDHLITHPLIYVARDAERALGFDLPVRGYYIITSGTSAHRKLAKQFPKNIFTVEAERNLDTHELLRHPQTKKYISDLKGAGIMVFKNTAMIEKTAKENHWKLLNPPARLVNRVEEKLEQVKWLREYADYLPPHEIAPLRNIMYEKKPFILQFNHAHSGQGTMLIKDRDTLDKLASAFPDREVRKTDYIAGPVFTSNNVILGEQALMGNLSYQITGLPPLTDLPFATIGNDFSLPHRLLTSTQLSQYKKMVTNIGHKLAGYGWKGLFGLDIAVSETTGRVHLIEINARQPASAIFESKLERDNKKRNVTGITCFEAHVAALMGIYIPNASLTPLSDGAQIVQRITKKRSAVADKVTEELGKLGLNIVTYENNAHNSELLRIQSKKYLMDDHEVLNNLGEKIKNLLD